MELKLSGVSVIDSSVSSRAAASVRHLFQFVDRFARRATLARATFEVGVIGLIWGFLYRELSVYPSNASTVAFMVIVASALFVGSFRMSPSTGLVTGTGRELFALLLFLGPTLSIQIAIGWRADVTQLRDPIAPFAILLANSAVFVVGRFLTVGLPWWFEFHQRKLRWQLVQAHIVVVLTVLSVPALLSVVALYRYTSYWFIDSSSSPVENIVARIAYRLIPALALLVVMFGLTLIVVVPPSIGLSYFVARRMTRRLEQLAAATTAIREGNHSARVAVRGMDEVAELQTNFNAMAGVLENAIAEAADERDKIARLLDERRELIASVSHELRTPLTIIRGYLDSSLAREERLDPALERDLTVMHGEAVRLQRLINDLFALSRAEVGSLTMQTRQTDIRRTLQRCVDAMSSAAWRTRRVEILFEAAENLPDLEIDTNRLEQIVFNLIDNAVRHSAPGALVHINATRLEDHVQIEVSDTGEGIPPDEIDRIWERFYRGSTSSDARGSGIGLAVVRELTEAMGGEVTVESTPGEGSCFRLLFPIDDDVLKLPAEVEPGPVIPAVMSQVG